MLRTDCGLAVLQKCSHNVTMTFCQCDNIATRWQRHCENVSPRPTSAPACVCFGFALKPFASPLHSSQARDRIQYYQTGEEFIFPYDLGSRWENFKQVFTWSGVPEGDGMEWPVHEKCHQHTLTVSTVTVRDPGCIPDDCNHRRP